jgi:hypothetical protein
MATAESETDTDTDVQTTDGVPTDALQLVIERAEIELGELGEYGEAPEEFVAEVQEAIETVKEAVENDDTSGDQADETPELTVGEPTDDAGLALIFRVHGVDLTDERFAGMFDVGAECAGIEYPQDGAEHMAHDASNIVYHGLKERFGWADEQVSGVAPGVERFEKDN